MISFIIIGKNEGWKLTQCLESIFQTIKQNSLTKYEVIYVDSRSIDDSIERAKKFPELRIFQLTGDMNAAIGRNVGAKESKGDVLFFIDGDMAIIPEALTIFFTEEKGLIYPFVSGDFDNCFYNHNWEFQSKDLGLLLKNDKYESAVGGLFLIEKKLWESVKGMQNVYKKAQDGDLTLRLAKKGTLLLRKKEMLAHHHMIPYLDKKRRWQTLLQGKNMYARSFLYRNHVFNPYCWKRILLYDYSLVALLGSITMLFMFHTLMFFVIYFLLLIYKVKKNKRDYLESFSYYVCRDIVVSAGLVFFWPKKKKNITYQEVKL